MDSSDNIRELPRPRPRQWNWWAESRVIFSAEEYSDETPKRITVTLSGGERVKRTIEFVQHRQLQAVEGQQRHIAAVAFVCGAVLCGTIGGAILAVF